jgi:hypothetical protein
MFWRMLILSVLKLVLIADTSKVTYIDPIMSSKKQLVEGKERGKDCRNWSRTQPANPGSPVFLSSCYKPQEILQPCYLERPQTRVKKIGNLVLDLEVQPGKSCTTGKCRLEISLVIYRSEGRPVTQKISYTGFSINERLQKIYLLEKDDKINAIYLRITPIEFCGAIENYRLYTGVCAPLIVDLASFSEHVPGNDSEQVIGKCVENATPDPVLRRKLPTANCSAVTGNYTNVIGRCVCKKGFTRKGDQCIGKLNK